MEDKIVVGVTGRIRAGKETVARYLAERHGATEVSSSDALYDTFRLFGIPLVRKSPQELSQFLRTAFRDSALEYPVINAIERSKDRLFVVTSLRRESDYAEIQQRFRFYLLFVDARLERRYQWFMGELKDPRDCGVTLEEFQSLDDAESETLIEGLRTHADCIIHNNGTIAELETSVSRFVTSIEI